MLSKYLRKLQIVAASAAIAACWAGFALKASPATCGPVWQSARTVVVGTWTGTSTCVGNRPACKNETVVYRFVPLEGHPTQVRLLADKIIDGKRVPMGALVFDIDEQTRTLRSEFRGGQTHGVWSYTVVGDAMTGRLVILPDGSIGRDVKVHRAKETDLPAPPPLSDYDK